MSNLSNYPSSIDVLKTLPETQDMTIDDKISIGRYNTLISKSVLTFNEQEELRVLVNKLKDKMISSGDWNKVTSAIVNLETYFKDQVLDDVQGKIDLFENSATSANISLSQIKDEAINSITTIKNSAVEYIDNKQEQIISEINQVKNNITSEVNTTKDEATTEILTIKNEGVSEINQKLANARDVLTEVKKSEDNLKEQIPNLNQVVSDIVEVKPTLDDLNSTIEEAKDDIATIKATGNEIVFIKSSEWVLNDGIYEKEIVHSCNSENLHISCTDEATKEAMVVGYKIIDKNRILLKSDEAVNSKITISASYFKAVQTVSDDVVLEVINARGENNNINDRFTSVENKIDTKISYVIDESSNIETPEISEKLDSIDSQYKSIVKEDIPELRASLADIENEKANTSYVENINNNFKNYSTGTLENYEDDYLLAYDGFERENGSSLTNLEIGGTWYTVGGSWQIQDGLAYTSGQTTYSLAYTSCGNSDCTIEVDLRNVSICEKSGIAFRVVDDNNFLFVGVHQGHLGLYRCNNGNISLFKGTDLGNRIYTNGKITVVLRGVNIKIYYDSFLKIDLDFDLGTTSVKHGLVVGSTNSNAKFDNFKIIKSNLTKLEKNITLKTDNSENNWYWSFEKDSSKSYSQQFINNELRIELRKTDELVVGSYRSEVRLPNEQACESHIYSFDIKLSDIQGEFDDDVSPEILAQFHASANPDGTNFSAPLSLMARNGNFIIDINWDDYYKTSNDQITQKGNNASINLGAYKKGKWYNFTFKVKWGWHKALKPMLEIYQDGILVVNRPYMPNCMNNIKGNFFKIGVYKYDWKNSNTQSTTTKRVVYYRNVKVI